jgi:excisionase family DNA binding protein
MSHMRPYAHRTWYVQAPAGKPVACHKESRCTMPTTSTGDHSASKFLTVAEVAAMMRVSKMTVYRLVHGGELPAVRVGRSFRVLEEDVDEYLRKSFYSAG